MKKNLFLLVLCLIALHQRAVAQNWSQIIKAVASDRSADDYFGHSVSISGDYAVVGVPQTFIGYA
jgi:hypothetical protein